MPWKTPTGTTTTPIDTTDPKTIFDIDLTTQAAADYHAAGDGSVSLGGYSFDIANTANAESFGIVPGEGLKYTVIPSDFPTSELRPGSPFTAPSLIKSLNSIQGFDPYRHKLELTAQYTGVHDQSGEQTTIGFLSNFTPNPQWQISIGRRQEGVGGFLSRWGDSGGPNYKFDTSNTSSDFLRIVYNPMSRNSVSGYGELLADPGPYPPPENYTFMEVGYLNSSYSSFGFRNDAILFFAFSNSDGAASNNHTAAYKRIRLRLI